MGLPIGVGGAPTEKTVREFEQWLRERSQGSDVPRYLVLHEHIVKLVMARLEGRTIWAMDSTPMWCFGALKGTLRMLADGLRSLVRRVLRFLNDTTEFRRFIDQLPWLKSKSAKGGLDVDWRDREDRHRATDEVARGVLATVELISVLTPELPPAQQSRVLRQAQLLLQVIESDLEEDDNGRLTIARKVTKDRMVSITDPEARSGRKTRSQPYKGFKLHVLGDVNSRLILAMDVVAANAPEAPAGHALVRRARRIRNDLETVLADTAYGATKTRTELGEEGVDLISPPQPVPVPANDRLPKHAFGIDFERDTAMCPAGVETDDFRTSGARPRFVWPLSTCAECMQARRCLPKRLLEPRRNPRGRPRMQGRSLVLHEDEQALRRARQQWLEPERRVAYRRRAECEQLVNDVVRHGARQARAFGIAAARLQAHAIGMRCNLGLLARILHRETNA